MAEALSELYGPPLPDNIPRSLWERFSNASLEYPDKVALVCTHQPSNLFGITSTALEDDEYYKAPYLRWTYTTLRGAIKRLVRGLRVAGVENGMPLFTFTGNSAEFIITFWATYELGCIMVPINPRNLSNREEVKHMINVGLTAATVKRAVVVAENKIIAEQVDLLSVNQIALRVVVGSTAVGQWIPFDKAMEDTFTNGFHTNRESVASHEDIHEPNDNLILFTSGTTSLPKGCINFSPQLSIWHEMRYQDHGMMDSDAVACIAVPINHSMGLFATTVTISCGATVVYSGPGFDPEAMLKGLRIEKCTHTFAVPVMIHALLSVQKRTGQKLPNLKVTMLGGSMVTASVLEHTLNDLGSAGVENLYGMTEGPVVVSGLLKKVEDFVNGDDITVGHPAAGCRIKICAPGETSPLPRGVPGELHFSSPSLVAGYVGIGKKGFYTDSEGYEWFLTGDQAIIEADGRTYISGRYKDLIIRGGENVAPAAIEAAVATDPKLAALQMQIVGAPDDIAGEVPVAVVHPSIDHDTKQELLGAIRKRMGNAFVPTEVISTKELGIGDYPKTMAGKVQKAKLAAVTRQYLKDRDEIGQNDALEELESLVKQAWARAIGIDPSRISVDAQITDFADSITVMRVRDSITKQTGRSLSLAEMADVGTIRAQLKLLATRPQTRDAQPRQFSARKGPPIAEDMVHLTEDPTLFEATRDLILKAVKPHGLEWEDVWDVIPVYDFSQIISQTGMMESLAFKMAILTNQATKQELRPAIEATFKNNCIITSFVVWDEEALESDIAIHAVLRQNAKLLDLCIIDGGILPSSEDLKRVALKYPYPDHATLPGPLARALLFDIEETKSAAVVFSFSHAVIDASSARLILDDLDQALQKKQLQAHTDYKLWADSYYSLKTTPEARAATRWYLKRLKNLNAHRSAIWPSPDSPRHSVLGDDDGVDHNFEAPGLQKLRKKYRNITAPVALKTAHTLLNVYRTNHTHALFVNVEAARTRFPFIPKSMEHMPQYEATDVAGPCVENVLNLIEINSEETVLEFLNRMQDDQNNITKYASAPWNEIRKGLGPAGDMLTGVNRMQIFNWVPGMGLTGTNPHENFEVLNAIVRPGIGFIVNAGLGGPEGNTLFMRLRGDAMSKEELGKAGSDLEKIMVWLTSPENWDAKVGQFRDCFAKEI